jgi:hypothetical protein
MTMTGEKTKNAPVSRGVFAFSKYPLKIQPR